MCQPGPAAAPGLSQPGRSGGDGFHSTKSPGRACTAPHRPARRPAVRPGCGRTDGHSWIARHREQHVAFRRIGVARRDQRSMISIISAICCGGARLLVRRQRAKRRHVGVEVGRRARGDRGDRLAAVSCGARVDLVVHVGDVAHIGHARIQPPQQPRQHVVHHHRCAHCRHAPGRRPSRRTRTSAHAGGSSGSNRSFRRLRLLCRESVCMGSFLQDKQVFSAKRGG